jgi:hypothetical protein
MSTEQMSILMLKASESLSALWYSQLEVISEKIGVSMDVLCGCFNLQVPMVPLAEKKKRAPAKKKEAVAEAVSVNEGADNVVPLVEKKKRAPAKKKGGVVEVVGVKEGTESNVVLPDEKKEAVAVDVKDGVESGVVEKKKRAPAKKKDAVAVAEDVNDGDESGVVEKKKRAPAKKKDAVVEDVKDGDESAESAVVPVVEKKKRAPAKKKDAVAVVEDVKDGDESAVVEKKKQAPAKKNEVLYIKELVDWNTKVAESVVEKKKRAPAKKKEAVAKAVVKAVDVNEDEESCSGNTVPMKPDRIDVEEVVIGGSSFLVADDGRAYLKSSRQVVGKYDPTEKTMKPLSYDDDEEDAGDDDECPVLSDLSDDE